MAKALFIAEKPSVAREFGKALQEKCSNKTGYMESEHYVITWCVGHLVTMSYPDVYDEKYKRWRLETLPFLPATFRYEVIKSAAKQYEIVAGLLHREDVDTIYVCTDSGREGEYIYRLVEQMAGVSNKQRKRVWIDSQTEEEIQRGIKEAKDLSEYDHLSDAAYLRAKEDYLMGINFSRLLSIKYGTTLAGFFGEKYTVISVGRVMTCVMGMVVRREREIREFVKTPFYRVLGDVDVHDTKLTMEWKSVVGSKYEASPLLYKENGFKEKESAIVLANEVAQAKDPKLSFDENDKAKVQILGAIHKAERKKEKKNPPLLYNLAELQNDCSKLFKISPDETLAVVQELYEKKLVTYPRTDARVLSSAVAKEIEKNLKGIGQLGVFQPFVEEILTHNQQKGLEKTRYVNDKQITDHYAIVPTGQGLSSLSSLEPVKKKVYEIIVRRFLAIFYGQAVYEKLNVTAKFTGEYFFATAKYLIEPGYQKVMEFSFAKKKQEASQIEENQEEGEDLQEQAQLAKVLGQLKKGDEITLTSLQIKEGETSPPKRYNSGTLILAMENAGQLIEDEELRSQIKGSGIGTSATRAEILKKLVNNQYLALNKKTQVITPTLRGEMIFDVVSQSIPSLLNPELTASWEKGLTMVAQGEVSTEEYMTKLEQFIRQRTQGVLNLYNQGSLRNCYQKIEPFYVKGSKKVK